MSTCSPREAASPSPAGRLEAAFERRLASAILCNGAKYIGPAIKVQEGVQGHYGRNHAMAIIECVPNVSEGRRTEVLDACADAIRRAGVRLLDVKPDAAHNRTVFTFAGEPAAVKAAVNALFGAALPRIDLRQHQGEHPRMGAVDVVPFIPIEGVTMADCVRLAVDVAATVAERFALPVYLYEDAATDPARRNLEDVRR